MKNWIDKYFKMNQISNFYKWQNYNGVSENYSNDIQYRFAITDCFGWKAFYFVFFFFVPGYNFSLFNRVSNQSLPMFCVFHGIETRPMLLLTPYKSNNMLETICYIDVHRIMCRLKRNFYLRTSDKKKGEREERKSKTRKYLTNFHQFSKWQTRFILPNRTWFSNRSDHCQQQRTFSHTLDETTLIATLRGKQLRVWSSSLLGINEKKKKKRRERGSG